MKRKIISLLIVISMLLSFAGCGNTETPSSQSKGEHIIKATNLMADYEAEKTAGKEADTEFVKNQMTLALKLFKASADESKGENVLISPLSIQLALAMTANGANGQTKEEMEALLGGENSLEELNEYLNTYVSNLPSDEKYKLEIANSIWFKSGGINVNDSFLQTNKNYYNADIYQAPFDQGTVEDINSWVSDKTDGMIEEIIQQIDPNSIMFLINAIMFDAEWAGIYSTHDIRDGEFTLESGEKQAVKMMHSEEHRYIELDNAIGFKKNYKFGKYSFVALLPNEGTSLDELVSSLEEEELLSAIKYADMTTVYASMPKFSYEYTLTMNDVLKALGMQSAFDSENADFTEMGNANGNIYVSSVTHKTFITVDEAGTKAGAVTSVDMTAEGMPTEIKIVNLDRPFLYMIVDNQTNLPIFIGTLTSVE